MATLQTKAIQPSTGSNVNLGTSGDAVLLNSDSIQTNLYKDAGGNTILQSDGAGTLSNVNSGLKGAGPVLIQSQTASSSASISFTTGIDSTYDKYMFVFLNIHAATNEAELQFQTGASYNTATTSTAFWAYHSEAGSSSGLTYATSHDAAQSTSFITLGWDQPTGVADGAYFGNMTIYAPASTTFVKQWLARVLTSAQPRDEFTAGYVNTTAAITQIRFQMSSGNIDDGTIYLYGIK
jgi:hypothetical protein